jgi:hypothetical protein
MKLPTKLLKLWANTLDETLARSGLPMRVTGGETAPDGHTTFDIPAPQTAWTQDLARALGVQEVRVKLQIEVVPLVVVVKVYEPQPQCEQHLEPDWMPCYVRCGPGDIPTGQGCQHVTGIRGVPFVTGG